MRTRRRIVGSWGVLHPEMGVALDSDGAPILFPTKSFANEWLAASRAAGELTESEWRPVRVTVRYPLLPPRRPALRRGAGHD
jgi:hypothetical protein